MFLAGKVEETPRPLKDVILVSYEIINKKDPTAVQRIKQKVSFIAVVLAIESFLYLLIYDFLCRKENKSVLKYCS